MLYNIKRTKLQLVSGDVNGLPPQRTPLFKLELAILGKAEKLPSCTKSQNV